MIVFCIEHLVQFYQKLLVDSVEKVWHFKHFSIEDTTVASGDLDSKELKELDDLLVGSLHLLLEKDEDQFVDLGDCLVDGRRRKVFEWLQGWLVNAVCRLVLPFVSLNRAIQGHNVVVPHTRLIVATFVAVTLGTMHLSMVVLACHLGFVLLLLETVLERHWRFLVVAL